MLNRTIPPQLREPGRMDVLRPDIRLLPNGARLYLLPDGENDVVRLDLLMEGGRWHQHHPLQALFTNRMLREGTRSYTSARIAELLDFYGAWLELSATALHSCLTLYTLGKYLPQTLDLLRSMLSEPSFPERELQVTVDANVQQHRVNLSKVSFLSHRALVQALYGGSHPCGRVVEEEDYRHITAPMLHDFYHYSYHPYHLHIYMAGKIGEEDVRMVSDRLGTLPFGSGQPAALQLSSLAVTPADGKRFFVERKEAMQSAVRMGQLTIDNRHPDFQKLRLLVTLLGGYFGSRLMSNIREEKGYTYGITASLATYPDHSLLLISSETTNELVEPLIGEVYHEIDRLQNDLVSEEELTIVKNYKLGETCRELESVFSLSDAWIFVQSHHLQPDYFQTMLEEVKSVTPQDIRDLAMRYLCKETLKESVSGKKTNKM